MAVPKRKKSLLKRKQKFNSFKKKRSNYIYFKKCLTCNLFIRNHTYCLNCI